MIIRQRLIRTVEEFSTLFLWFLSFVSTAVLEFSHQLSTSWSFSTFIFPAMNLQIEFIEFFDWLLVDMRRKNRWGRLRMLRSRMRTLTTCSTPPPTAPPPSSCTSSASSISTTWCWYHHSAFVAWSFIWFPDLSSVNAMSKLFVLNQVQLFE